MAASPSLYVPGLPGCFEFDRGSCVASPSCFPPAVLADLSVERPAGTSAARSAVVGSHRPPCDSGGAASGTRCAATCGRRRMCRGQHVRRVCRADGRLPYGRDRTAASPHDRFSPPQPGARADGGRVHSAARHSGTYRLRPLQGGPSAQCHGGPLLADRSPRHDARRGSGASPSPPPARDASPRSTRRGAGVARGSCGRNVRPGSLPRSLQGSRRGETDRNWLTLSPARQRLREPRANGAANGVDRRRAARGDQSVDWSQAYFQTGLPHPVQRSPFSSTPPKHSRQSSIAGRRRT